MGYLITAVLIGFVILFHEFGHLIAAKKAGIPVAVFSVGFGPRIIGIKRGGETEYRLSLIPLGGYVLPAIEDENEFFSLPVHKRILMSLGGPIASIVLPVICLAVIFSLQYGLSLQNVLYRPLVQTSILFYKMVVVIPAIFSHPQQLSGVIGIVSQGGSFVGMNFINALQFAAFLSLNLAVLNLLPVPALDGGKVLLYLLERIHPKLLRVQIPLAIAGWLLMIWLMLYVTIIDIRRLLCVFAG